MRKHPTSLLLTVLALCGGVRAQWHGDVAVDGGAGYPVEPHVAMDGAHLYCLFVDRNVATDPGRLASSHDAGRTWSTRALGIGERPDQASLHARGGLLALSWIESRSGTRDSTWVRVSSDGGSTWIETELSAPAQVDATNPTRVWIEDPEIFVLWSANTGTSGSSYTTWLQVSGDRGATWLGAPQDCGIPTFDQALVVDRDELHLLRVEAAGGCCGYEALNVYSSTNQGRNWSSTPSRIDLPVPGHTLALPRLVEHGSRIAAAWIETYTYLSTDPSEAWHAYSDDQGATWSRPTRLSVAVPFQFGGVSWIDLAADGDRLLATYIQNYTTGWNISDGWLRSSPDGGASWSGPTRINLQPGTLGRPPLAEPRVTLHGSRAFLSWLETSGTTPLLLSRRTTDFGWSWSAPSLASSAISTPPQLDLGATTLFQVATDDEGGATWLWKDRRSGTNGALVAHAVHQPDLVLHGAVEPGQSFFFELRGADETDFTKSGLVLWSASGTGLGSGGLPLGGGRRLDLAFDTLTIEGLTGLVAWSVTSPLMGPNGTTLPAQVPPGIALPPLWAAALTLDARGIGSLSSPLRLR